MSPLWSISLLICFVQVNLHLGSSVRSCDLSLSFHVSCPDEEPGENLTVREGPVTDNNQALLGFTLRGKLRPVQNFTAEFAPFIAADFARRRMAGEKRLLKCKKSENSALQFILVNISLLQIS